MSGSRLSLSALALVAAAGVMISSSEVAFGQATTNPAAGTVAPAKPRQKIPANLGAWWNDTAFYEIFVRSFADSTTGPLAGDGIGDFRGLIEKLDYLNDGKPETTTDLGITGIWLMPIYPSPSYHGYDITNYNDVNPEYGTMADFKELVAECHKRGIKVIIDMVLNHCSSEHPWFKAAAADPKSEYRDFFIWEGKDPGWRGPWGQQVWWEKNGSFYYGLFSSVMPDLNFRNPKVTKAANDIQSFWLKDVGVDGLRLDAIRHLIENGQQQENTPETHEWLKNYFKYYKSVKADALTVGEVWAGTDVVSQFVGDQMDLAFEFDLAGAILNAVRDGKRGSVDSAIARIKEFLPQGQYGTFLANHDQNRTLSQLGGPDYAERAFTAAAIQLTMPGVPFIYYGEEIGMIGVKPDEDIRTPMQWSGEKFAGFSTARPWRPANTNYKDFNVAGMQKDPQSLWHLYGKLLRLRQEYKTLRTGDITMLETSTPQVLAYARHGAAGTPEAGTFVIVANLGPKEVADYSVTMPEALAKGAGKARELLQGGGAAAAPKAGEYTPTAKLKGETVYVFKVE